MPAELPPAFRDRLQKLVNRYEGLASRQNSVVDWWTNGVFERFEHPVLTGEHAPLSWRYDLNPQTNPHLLERLGSNAAMNSGAIWHDGRVFLMPRMEGVDRKSYFGLCSSETGLDNFRFHGGPIKIDPLEDDETNHYDMRFVEHEDGHIYGMFCVEKHDPSGGTNAAIALGGLARTKNLVDWERLPNLQTTTAQQRNHVLHPEFVDGKYAFYTRPQDSFIHQTAATGSESAVGIGFGLCESMEKPVITEEQPVDGRQYHTIKELKNGQGPAPIKTDRGWLHLAHGVRECAAGMRYVLYLMMTDLAEPWKVIHRPGGHFIAPLEGERVGDVSNVAFSNGWVRLPDDTVLIYYASCDTRLHVARSSVEKLVDYCINTPEDPLRTYKCVQQRRALFEKNRELAAASDDPLLQRAMSVADLRA
jgi:4-O-beta-D-mannosyl-D-glucose phosphorylase